MCRDTGLALYRLTLKQMTITYTRKATRLNNELILRLSNKELMEQLLAYMQELPPFAHEEMKSISDAMRVVSTKLEA